MPKKILIISYSFLPDLSGVAEVVYEYAKQMLKTNYAEKVTVIARNKNKLAKREKIDGIDLLHFDAPAFLGGRIPLPSKEFFADINQIIRTERPDQIHVHTRFSTTTLFGVIIAKWHKIPVVEFEHLSNYITGESKAINTASWIWDQTISRLIFVLADKIICVSNSTKNFICKNLGANPKKTFAIENGCDFTPSPETIITKIERDQKTSSTINILFAARMVALKNPILTLEAIKILAEKNLDFKLKIAGDGKVLELAKQFVKENNLEDKVEFLGKQPHSELRKHLEKSQIFINISELEGLPGGVIEALLSNNLCLVSDVGGNNDVITVSDLLIPKAEMTPAGVANKLEFVIKNLSSIAEKLENDKQRVAKNDTWEMAMSKLAEVL